MRLDELLEHCARVLKRDALLTQRAQSLLTWARELHIHFSGGDANVRVCADDHDGSVGGERADKSGEGAVANVHRQRLALAAATRQLELLDDVGDLFEAVHVVVLLPAALSDDEECHALKQNHLHSIILQQRFPTKNFDAVLAAAAAPPHPLRMSLRSAQAAVQAGPR